MKVGELCMEAIRSAEFDARHILVKEWRPFPHVAHRFLDRHLAALHADVGRP
jgi:hypothetical protein